MTPAKILPRPKSPWSLVLGHGFEIDPGPCKQCSPAQKRLCGRCLRFVLEEMARSPWALLRWKDGPPAKASQRVEAQSASSRT